MAKPCVPTLVLVLLLTQACSKKEASPHVPAKVTGPVLMEASATGATPSVTSTNPAVTQLTIPPAWPRDVIPTSDGPLTIVPIHHASLLLVHDNKALYVDPTAEGSYDGLPKANLIFVTHEHPDHLDLKQIGALSGANTSIVAGHDPGKMIGAHFMLRNGESHFFGRFMVEAIPAYNNVRGPAPGKLYHPKGVGNGYVFTFGDQRVYVSGDTECTQEMKALKNIDVAFIAMRLPYTMPPSEAADCIKAFRPKIVYPYHYQSSNLAELQTALMGESGIELRVREWYRKGPPSAENPLAKMLPEKAGPFASADLVSDPQFLRRQYSRGATRISVTLAMAGATPMTFDEWVKMSATSPQVKLDAPASSVAGFYDCAGEGAAAPCNVHIHFRAGFHMELMGEGKARKSDFDALLRELPMRQLAVITP